MKLIIAFMFMAGFNGFDVQTHKGFKTLDECNMYREALRSEARASGDRDDKYQISACKEYKEVARMISIEERAL